MIHLLALPNAQTTRSYSLCGFTQTTLRFAEILKGLGERVTLYASEENEAPCYELVTCVPKAEILDYISKKNLAYQYCSSPEWLPIYKRFNDAAIAAIAKRKQPRDIIALIGGTSQRAVTDAHPDLLPLEYSIGYIASYAPYRVFQSYAWMHNTYGTQRIENGRFYDDVIPPFFDPDTFDFCEKPEDYIVYLGRLTHRKGITVACEIATRAKAHLKIIGHGDPKLITGGHEYLGPLDWVERNKVIAKAKAMLCPTLYIEPFGCAAAEAQLCGTPVISPDFGGFVESVEHGKTGFRCHLLQEFADAVKSVSWLDRSYIHERAFLKYSMQSAVRNYKHYFKRLQTLWDGGWYAGNNP